MKMNPIIHEKDQQTSSLELAKFLPHIQQHFLRPNKLIYYIDFTLSELIGDATLVLASRVQNWSAAQAIYILVSVFFLFRASIFVHEAYHSGKHIKGFVLYYNLLHGFMHKLPYYCYTPHRHHHSPETYGTLNDPEYEILGDKPASYNIVIAPIFMMAILPLYHIIRWGILPIIFPFIGSKAREAIYENASTAAMNRKFKRKKPSEAEKKEWYIEDAGCVIYSIIFAWLIYADILPLRIAVLWYITLYLLSVANFYRVMMNHRFFTGFEGTNHKQQIIDSITLPISAFNALFHPVGSGYHALHHMFPQIPYHNLGKAHRWLIKTLPENHPYRVTVVRNYFTGVKELLDKKF